MHVIRVAHSPDSDDAFMYYGIACGAVRGDGIRFEQALSDIESANAAAQEGRFDLTAISAAAYPSLAARYLLLDSGASFGDGYGPCVVVPAGSRIRRLEDLAGTHQVRHDNDESDESETDVRAPSTECFIDFEPEESHHSDIPFVTFRKKSSRVR